LVDLKAQYETLRGEVAQAMARVLESTAFILGPQVAEFEAAFAAFTGAAACVGVSSGTAALELALRAVGVGPGDEVITVAHTFIATAEAISAAGATPIFVDIESARATLDAQAFAAALTQRTRAVIPVHLYGQPANMEAICGVARRAGVAVIEDAAQAHGATLNGRGAGTLGDIGCFSFYPGKNLGAYGDAGAVTTDDEALAARVRLLRNHGRSEKYLHEVVGFGERLDTLQAAVLLTKLPHLARWTQARTDAAARYSALLADSGLILPEEVGGAESAWHLYVVRLPGDVAACESLRDGLRDWLRANGVESGVHYPVPLHLQRAYASLGYRPGSLPITERWAQSCLSLPLFPELRHDQQDRVVALLLEFCRERL
jgi:dTDP-4-amino-4,6-dideoxygalactose transaminase